VQQAGSNFIVRWAVAGIIGLRCHAPFLHSLGLPSLFTLNPGTVMSCRHPAFPAYDSRLIFQRQKIFPFIPDSQPLDGCRSVDKRFFCFGFVTHPVKFLNVLTVCLADRLNMLSITDLAFQGNILLQTAGQTVRPFIPFSVSTTRFQPGRFCSLCPRRHAPNRFT